MLRSERGSSLLLVLIVSVVFLVLGLSILSATLGGSLRSKVRETSNQDVQAAKTSINETILAYQKEINIAGNGYLTGTPELFDSQIQSFTNALQTSGNANYIPNIKITELDPLTSKGKYYKKYKITYNKNLTYSRSIIIAPIPSFLDYVAGSEGNLELNGASSFRGNVYVNHLTVRQHTALTDADPTVDAITKERWTATNWPSIQGIMYYANTYQMELNKSKPTDPTTVEQNLTASNTPVPQESQINKFFSPKQPALEPFSGTFVDVDFSKTVVKKVEDAFGKTSNIIQLSPNNSIDVAATTTQLTTQFVKGASVAKLCNQQGDYLALSESELFTDTFNAKSCFAGRKGVIFTGSDLYIQQDFILPKSAWLLATGNVLISTASGTKPKVQGNVIALGNLSIIGNVDESGIENDTAYFNSTIYVNGKTTVENTNIEGLQETNSATGTTDREVVIISNGDLFMNRINEFKTVPTLSDFKLANNSAIKPLKGYFYTKSNATLYGIGSFFYIEGGLFARGNLKINAMRGTPRVSNNRLTFDPVPADLNNLPQSRFQVKYNPDVIANQLDALPRVDAYRIFVNEFKQDE